MNDPGTALRPQPGAPGAGTALRLRWRGRRGLALISVLWVLTLLALIAASFTRTTRTEVNLARNQSENAKAAAIADAGLYRAVLDLTNNDPQRAWRADGTIYAWRFADGEIRAALWDEGGKIDLNAASDQLLRNLFLAAGVDEGEATVLVDAIIDFRDPNDLRQLNGAEARDYRDAGLPYGPKDAPFEALEELRQVYGMTAAVYERVAPGLTVHARQRAPHEATAPPLVRAALSGEVLAPADDPTAVEGQEPGPDAATGAEVAELSEAPEPWLGPVDPLPRSPARTFTLHVEARTDSGAIFVREAIVRLGRGDGLPFELRSWKQGRRELFVREPAAP